MRYKITLSYSGAPFAGWQRQDNAKTVQGTLEEALKTLLGVETTLTGAGRTDAGVNAENYVAHFDLPFAGPGECPLLQDAERLCYKMNAILPHEIVVHSICPVSDDFHARFGAVSREYKYYIHRGKNPFLDAFSWQCRFPLDVERMNEACQYLAGVHDCSCFEKSGGSSHTPVCEIFEAFWSEEAPGRLVFTVRANRFLRNMVRAIVGTMVDIGRGRRTPQYIAEILDGRGTRSDAGQSVPAKALFLHEVRY